MKRITIIVLTVLILASIGGLIFYRKASKEQITVAGDNYLGYWPIVSQKMEKNLRSNGYTLKFVNDGGDYPARHKNFAEKKYDIMVLPISTYLSHGKDYYYPGAVGAIISDSKGADNVLCRKSKLVGQESREPTVNDLNNGNLKIGLTPDSPSSFLFDTAIVHFGLDNLRGKKIIETNGSGDAYERFVKGDLDCAVLWEPDVSKALALPGVVSVYGSDKVSGMIVDVFVIGREFLNSKPDAVDAFFKSYFETLVYYDTNKEEMLKEVAKISGLKREAVLKSLQGVAWFGFKDNHQDWFGLNQPIVVQPVKRERLIDTAISQITKVMVDIGSVKGDPLQGNPNSIIDDRIIQRLNGRIAASGNIGASVPANIIFAPLTDAEWTQLKVVGTMKILPILFQPGTSNLTSEGSNTVNQAAIALSQNYPQYRILIKGHTAPSSDEAANVALSQERADSVKKYFETTHSLGQNRVRAVGVGSKEPLPRTNEGELSYRSRLSRVEFILLENRR